METIVELSRKHEGPRFQIVEPDLFGGQSTKSEAWLSFYDYACEKSDWILDEERIKNIGLFLIRMAKKWFQFYITKHLKDTWEQWKKTFQSAFQENPEKWDNDIFYKYKEGNTMEYLYEKQRLLKLADFSLCAELIGSSTSDTRTFKEYPKTERIYRKNFYKLL